MRKKFIGPANPGPDGQELGHDVSVNGRQYRAVKPGDVIEFPDELVAPRAGWPGVEFPAALWEDAPAETKKKKDGEG